LTQSASVELVDKMTNICPLTIQTVQWNMLTHFTHTVCLCINGQFKRSRYFSLCWLNIEYKFYHGVKKDFYSLQDVIDKCRWTTFRLYSHAKM